jgi:hypothetical protein
MFRANFGSVCWSLFHVSEVDLTFTGVVLLLCSGAGAAVGLSLTARAAGASDGGVLNCGLLAGAVLSWLGSTGAGGFLSADTDRVVLSTADHC